MAIRYGFRLGTRFKIGLRWPVATTDCLRAPAQLWRGCLKRFRSPLELDLDVVDGLLELLEGVADPLGAGDHAAFGVRGVPKGAVVFDTRDGVGASGEVRALPPSPTAIATGPPCGSDCCLGQGSRSR